MPSDPALPFVTEFGDEGASFEAAPLTLVHPHDWAAQAARDAEPLDRLTVFLEPRAASSASIALHLFHAALDAPVRAHLARVLRAGIERGLVGDSGDALAPREQLPVRVATLGAERDGQRQTYTLTAADGRERAVTIDLFSAALDAHTLFASVVATEDDQDDAAFAFALVTASLTLA